MGSNIDKLKVHIYTYVINRAFKLSFTCEPANIEEEIVDYYIDL